MNLILLSLIFGFARGIVWKECSDKLVRDARQFFLQFNQQLGYNYKDTDIVREECQYVDNYEHGDKSYIAFRIPIKAQYQCTLYFLYDFRVRKSKKTGLDHIVNRLLQPWEQAYLKLLEDSEEKYSDCTGIWEAMEEQNLLDRFKLKARHDIFDQKYSIELYGNYADRWVHIGGNDFMRLLIVIMKALGRDIDILQVKSRRKQNLLVPNFEFTVKLDREQLDLMDFKQLRQRDRWAPDEETLSFSVSRMPNSQDFDPATFKMLETPKVFEKHVNKPCVRNMWTGECNRI